MDELKRWTEYKIWVLAGTSVGDGPRSHPIIVRTHEDGMYEFEKNEKKNYIFNFFEKKKKIFSFYLKFN